MASHRKNSRRQFETAKARRNVLLLCLGVLLLLVLIAGFFWLISSPQIVRSN